MAEVKGTSIPALCHTGDTIDIVSKIRTKAEFVSEELCKGRYV